MDYRSLHHPSALDGYLSPPGVPSQPRPSVFPSPSSSSEERARQIKTLRIFNENVTELSANAQYRVDFEGEKGTPLSLFLTLGPYFPQEPPEIYLSPPPSHHPWTDPSGRVMGAPGLLAYNAAHTDLGRLVQAIKRQFQLTSLSVAPASNGGHPQYTHFSNASSTKNTNTFYNPAAASGPQKEEGALYFFPELSNLPSDTLQELHSDPTSLQLFLKTQCPSRSRILSAQEEEGALLKTEIQSSQSNLSNLSSVLSEASRDLLKKQSRLESLKSELIAATEAFMALKGKMGSPADVCDKFKSASLEKEEQSDHLAESFLDGEFDSPEEFLKEYFNLRNEYHLRKSQFEKMNTKVTSTRRGNPFQF